MQGSPTGTNACQAAVEQVVGTELLHKGVLVYVDDMLCYSEDVSAHLLLLRRVL